MANYYWHSNGTIAKLASPSLMRAAMTWSWKRRLPSTWDRPRCRRCCAQHRGDRQTLGRGVGRAGAERRRHARRTRSFQHRTATLSLPPAPPEEIPDMVRFPGHAGLHRDRRRLAARLRRTGSARRSRSTCWRPSSRHVRSSRSRMVCAASDLKPNVLVLRPFAAASLLGRSGLLDVQRAGLIVDLLADGVDLTAYRTGTGRLHAHRSIADRRRCRTRRPAPLVGEVRRTIGAAQNQMGGSRIEQIIVCGSDEEHAILRQALSESLSLEVVLFDPFQNVRLGRDAGKQLPPDLRTLCPAARHVVRRSRRRPYTPSTS